jgi:hypothetical protein
MRHGLGAVALTSAVIVFGAVYLRIEPLPGADQIREAERRRQAEHHAERLRDVPPPPEPARNRADEN